MAEQKVTLDKIRAVETAQSRQRVVAQERAQKELAAARDRAGELIAATRADGVDKGKEERQQITAGARRQADALRRDAKSRAEKIQKLYPDLKEAAVARALALVLGEKS